MKHHHVLWLVQNLCELKVTHTETLVGTFSANVECECHLINQPGVMSPPNGQLDVCRHFIGFSSLL